MAQPLKTPPAAADPAGMAWNALRRLLGRLTKAVAPRPDPRARLLRICHGDRDKAERLVAYERERAPGISDHTASVRAIERWQRDQ